ncbi:hypothetical protein G3T14_13105 [Methylobacterium sp. BTF04]|uniref:hypothetical protein n=1 Tax=Methylobacterium sp. BTF04 TaxID=2708300 RepID=UPI0013CF9C06|nr:hypothetical protein [Methylobacterium sp. BTF04]NEU13071.1 hypothetical protein [Methylobacterium sp. BTF04]
MSGSAEKTDPKLWDRIKTKVTESDKGGKPGQWSARKAQAATKAYKEAGGGYAGAKSKDNHLKQWTDEDWDTKSGAKSGDTGERYLPKKARAAVSDDEYARTTRKKRADTAKGRQFSKQPDDVAKKTAAAREGTKKTTKAALLAEARKRKIPGRSTMSKDDLEKALSA